MNIRVLILALGSFAIGTDGFMIAGILPRIAANFGVSVNLAGLLVTVFAIAYAIGSPILATLTSAMQRKRLLTLSLLLFAIANILAAIASTFGILMLARVLAAWSAAMFTPTAAATAAALVTPEQRGRALSLVTSGMTIAIVIGVPIGTYVGSHFSWRITFAAIGAVSLAATLAIQALFPAVSAPPSVSLAARLRPLTKPRMLATLGLTLFWTIGGFSVYTYISEVMRPLGLSSGTEISGLLLLFGVGSVVGNVIGGYSADKWGPVRTIAVGLTGVALAFVVLSAILPLRASMWTHSIAIADMLLWGISGWVLTPPQQHRLMSMMPQAPGIVLSLNGSFLYFGVGLGALCGGFILRNTPSIPVLTWSAAGWEALALLMLAFTVLGLKRQTSSDVERSASQTQASA